MEEEEEAYRVKVKLGCRCVRTEYVQFVGVARHAARFRVVFSHFVAWDRAVGSLATALASIDVPWHVLGEVDGKKER